MKLKLTSTPKGMILRAEDYVAALPPIPEPYFWALPYHSEPDYDHYDKAQEKLLYVARRDRPYADGYGQASRAWSHHIIAWYSGDGDSSRHRSLYYGRSRMGEPLRYEMHNVSFDEALNMLVTLANLGEL